MITLTSLLGLMVILVNFASALSIISQIRLTHHRKNTVGLSRVPWLMSVSNNVIGLAYSVIIGDLVFFSANLVWLLVNGTMLGLIFYYGKVVTKLTGVEHE